MVVQDTRGRRTDEPLSSLCILFDWLYLSGLLHRAYKVIYGVLGTFVHYSTLRVVCPHSCMQFPFSNFILAF